LAAHNVTINNVLPGSFDTDRIRATHAAAAQRQGRELEAVRAERIAAIPAHRLGRSEEFGAMCAFLCSAHAGYITGQNLLLDGGAYPGVL
jgi:3-oxoacyl-[acyl-carrier protein] reductase